MILHRIGALILVDRVKARAEVLGAIEKAEGNRARAAMLLEASERSLYRWVSELELGHAVDRLCKLRGFPVWPGPPRK